MLIDDPGKRLMLTRLVNEVQNGCAVALTRAFPDNHEHGAVFALLLREEAAHPTGARSISINGIAAALGRSFETIRRYVRALGDRRLVTVAATGLRLGPAVNTDPVLARSLDAITDHFRFFLAELARAGLWVAERGIGEPDRGACIAGALDLYLCALEFNAEEFGNWTRLLILGVVLTLNTRHIMRDLPLSERYGRVEDVPPLAARRPASVREVADVSGQPLETVRKHLHAATAQGLLVQVGRGYVLAPGFLSAEEVRGNAALVLQYTRRVLGDLARGRYRRVGGGLDPRRPDCVGSAAT